MLLVLPQPSQLRCDVQKSLITHIHCAEGLSRAAELGRHLPVGSRVENFRKGFSAGLAETAAAGAPTIPTCKMATVPFGFRETALAGCFAESPAKAPGCRQLLPTKMEKMCLKTKGSRFGERGGGLRALPVCKGW